MKATTLNRWLRWLTMLCGGALGAGVGALAMQLWRLLAASTTAVSAPRLLVYVGVVTALSLIGLIVAYLFAPPIIAWSTTQVKRVERILDETPMAKVFVGALGLMVGLAIAALVTQLFNFGGPSVISGTLSMVTYLVLGYLGVSVSTKRWREFPLLSLTRRSERQRERISTSGGSPSVKILDTSVIIDGRIFDICKTGLVDGPLVVPEFVLAELRHIADSSDALRRNRGRRGLDVLQRIQKELEVPVTVDDTDFDDVDEVDVKLLRLAQATGGAVVTNDYNLNKVANVTGVRVLNINDLANALKPVVLHGEEMVVHIVREGKEPGQGIGYLEDGTMIVVDSGRRYVGETVEVVVTTVLQTSAGRMIFTKVKQIDKVG